MRTDRGESSLLKSSGTLGQLTSSTSASLIYKMGGHNSIYTSQGHCEEYALQCLGLLEELKIWQTKSCFETTFSLKLVSRAKAIK